MPATTENTVRVPARRPAGWRAAGEVLLVAWRLGLTSFGGPAAHLGYFRREYVERRRWLDDRTFADLVALCQFLPGPASSQLGFAIGYERAGWRGGWLAWIGFTTPSAVLLLALALGLDAMRALGPGGLQGLKVAAAAVVAHAVWTMARTLCPDGRRRLLAATAAVALWCWPSAWMQAVVIAAAAAAGLALCGAASGAGTTAEAAAPGAVKPESRRRGLCWLAVVAAGLAGLPWLAGATGSGAVALVDRFFRTGAMVFGGGHVVLPLLEAQVVNPGWVDHDTFMAGYGAAQAVPGPLFSLAAYLGAVANVGPGGAAGALLALGALFLPGLLLVRAAWPFWQRLRRERTAQAALRGANAAVVGLLLAALVGPVGAAAVANGRAAGLALAVLAGLIWGRVPVWVLVLAAATAGVAWL